MQKIFLVLAIALSGCGSGDGAAGAGGSGGAGGIGDAGSPDAPIQCPATSGVSGTMLNTYVTESGERVVPADLTSVRIAAWIPASAGTPSMIAGTGRSDGTFIIAGVPEGTYYLQAGTTFLKTSARCVDLGAALMGRPDVSFATRPTNVTFNVTGLEAWAGGDDGQFFSLGGHAYAYHIGSVGTMTIPRGATSMNTVIDWQYDAYLNGLVDSAKGDTAFLTQLARRSSSNGTPYLALSRVFQPMAVTLVNGQPATISGAFTAPQPSSTVQLDWDHAMFASLVCEVHPNSCPGGGSLGLAAEPDGATLGPYALAPNLVEVYAPAGTATSLGTMNFANPFPSSWTVIGAAGFDIAAYYNLPGGNTQAALSGAIYSADLASRFTATTVRPLVGSVRAPLVDGTDAFGDRSGVALMPTLSWNSPAVGSPSGYVVTVYDIVDVGIAQINVVASVYTADTSVTLPPGILAAWQNYVFMITAVVNGGIDISQQPLRMAFPYGSADTLSGLMTTGAGGTTGSDGGSP